MPNSARIGRRDAALYAFPRWSVGTRQPPFYAGFGRITAIYPRRRKKTENIAYILRLGQDWGRLMLLCGFITLNRKNHHD
ncbi:MAG: hypothetical protein HAW59_01900 [Betaproteobacteria bacterium]|nr:hypothetical protein [Betaproteobacteria bacterium]